MKKRFVAILAISMLAVLTACGNKEKTVDSVSQQNQVSEIKESDEAVALTQEELNSFTELFSTTEYNGFLVRPFNSVNDIDWSEVLYNGAGIGATDVSEEEKDAFYKQASLDEECGDLVVLRANDIKQFVQSHAGVQYEDMKEQIGFEYVKDYDSYYSLHGDSNWMSYSCISGKKLGDLYIIQLHNDTNEDVDWHVWETPDIELTFEKNGDIYKMISNVWAWEVGNDESQTFDINVPGIDTQGRFITYQGNPESLDEANMIVTVDGKRLSWLGNYFGDNFANRDHFTTVKAVGIFDFTADGADDIVVIAEGSDGKDHVGLYEYGVSYDEAGYNYLKDASEWLSNYYTEELNIPNVKSYLLGDNEAAVYNTWNDAYNQVVRITILDGDYSYNLIYIDEDDVPELVVDNNGYYLYLYTYKDGHVVPFGDEFGYGAGGVADYEYAPKKNCLRYWNNDYAGIVCYLDFLSIHDNKMVEDYTCKMDNYDDLDGNGYPSEDEMTEEALANATGSTSYYANDKSLSQDAIEKKIEELQEYQYETIHGKYDSVEFYDVLYKK